MYTRIRFSERVLPSCIIHKEKVEYLPIYTCCDGVTLCVTTVEAFLIEFRSEKTAWYLYKFISWHIT